eukprot:6650433-Heterocapsa_arctica.AAC.1
MSALMAGHLTRESRASHGGASSPHSRSSSTTFRSAQEAAGSTSSRAVGNQGVFLGIREGTDEYYVGTKDGVARA